MLRHGGHGRAGALRRSALATLSLVTIACGTGGGTGSRGGGNEAVGAATGRPGGSSAGATAVTGAPVRATCDSVAAGWRRIAGVSVAVADTTYRALAEPDVVAGCIVHADAPAGVDSAHRATTFWFTAQARDWLPLAVWSADGPDGGTLTWERTAVRCEVRTEHDGGDDADSTYVPRPWEEEHTFCWAYHGPPTRRDTLGLDPAPPAPPGAGMGVVIGPARKRPPQ